MLDGETLGLNEGGVKSLDGKEIRFTRIIHGIKRQNRKRERSVKGFVRCVNLHFYPATVFILFLRWPRLIMFTWLDSWGIKQKVQQLNQSNQNRMEEKKDAMSAPFRKGCGQWSKCRRNERNECAPFPLAPAGTEGSLRRSVSWCRGREHCGHLDRGCALAAQSLRACLPVHGEASPDLESVLAIWPFPSHPEIDHGESCRACGVKKQQYGFMRTWPSVPSVRLIC